MPLPVEKPPTVQVATATLMATGTVTASGSISGGEATVVDAAGLEAAVTRITDVMADHPGAAVRITWTVQR